MNDARSAVRMGPVGVTFLALGCAASPSTPTPIGPAAPPPVAAPPPPVAPPLPVVAAPVRRQSLSCKDAGPAERQPLPPNTREAWQMSAWVLAARPSVAPEKVDGREPIYQRVTRELRGFLPLDPSSRLVPWVAKLDPPVREHSRRAFFLEVDGAVAVGTPIVELATATPVGLLGSWYDAGLAIQGGRVSYVALGARMEQMTGSAAARLPSGELVVAVREPGGARLCTATRDGCTLRIAVPGLSSESLGIARSVSGEVALLDLGALGSEAAPTLHRVGQEPAKLASIGSLVAGSEAQCGGATEWTAIARAYLRLELVAYPTWLLARLVAGVWCVDALDLAQGPLNRVVVRFTQQAAATRYVFADDASAVTRTPSACSLGPEP